MRMRKTIYISKSILFPLIFFLVGIILAFCGINSIWKENNAIELNQMNEADCMEGQYVKGEISSCIRKNITNLGNGSTSAISQEFTVGLMEYSFFTVPMKEDKYIQLMISDTDIIKALENNEEKVYLEGEIVKSPVEVNEQWYDDLINSDNFNTDSILSGYVIKEIRFKQRKEWLYAGVSLMIVSLMLYFLGGSRRQ